MKGSIPQYVVAKQILDASTLRTAQSFNNTGQGPDGTDIAMACCEVTLALSAADFPVIDLDACFMALEAEEVHHQGQFSMCTSLFDAASEMLRTAMRSQQDLQMATMGLSAFFTPYGPSAITIAPHLLFSDTHYRRDNKGNRYRARIRVARKGPSASCLLLEWGNEQSTMSGILVTGERFLESLLQIAALWQGTAEMAHHARSRLLAKTA